MYKKLESSNLDGLDYDEIAKILSVTFKNGKTYKYFGVSSNVVLGLQNSQSHGNYFTKNIKNAFRFEKDN